MKCSLAAAGEITGHRLSELIYSHLTFPVFSLCFVFAVEDVISELPAPISMPAACCQASPPSVNSSPSGTGSPDKFFLL